MKVFVTGAAGFIGSHLVERLLGDGYIVVGWDNFSTGKEAFLRQALACDRFTLLRGDNLNRQQLISAMAGCDLVFHLAANADVRSGLEHPEKDLAQNTIATFNVLEAMRLNGIKRLVFSSTGSVYGEASIIPTPEDAPFPVQTSLYAASKLAGEGLIEAYCEGFGFKAQIFRFVSILGERYTHGHVFDFYRQLLAHPDQLKVLGDGHQRKSYLYVGDCISAMMHMTRKTEHCEIYNLGVDDYCTVRESISRICAFLQLTPKLEFTGGDRGWIGDNPFIFLDTAKVRKNGWKPELSIHEAVIRTISWLRANPWVFE